MKIQYIANIRMPTEKAHGAQIMKACEAFLRAGAELELVIPDRKTPITEDPFAYYGIEGIFPIVRISTPDTVKWGKFGFILQSILFGARASLYAKNHPSDVIYGRDEIVLAAVSFFTKKKIIWESHDGAWNIWARYVARHAAAVVVVTRGAIDFYAGCRIPAARMLAVPNGIDLKDFAHPEPADASRKRLGLPLDKKVALYIGRIGGWKGVDTLLDASGNLPQDSVVAIIGGDENQIVPLRNKYPRVMFLGSRPYRELADNQAAADILILPNTGLDDVSTTFTSPMKLFSYLASGKPIVASDLPSIREIVDEKSAVFFEADNSLSLAQAIADTLHGNVTSRGVQGLALSKKYTWDARARSILSHIDSVL